MTESPRSSVLEFARALAEVLADLTIAHQELLTLIREHRAAITLNDAAAIQECLSRQGILAVQASELERTRQRLTAALTGSPRTTAAEVASRLPGEPGAAITDNAFRLRVVLAEVQRENNIVRSATQTLIAHIDGLMQQVARALSHAQVYGRKGRVESNSPVPCGIDMVH